MRTLSLAAAIASSLLATTAFAADDTAPPAQTALHCGHLIDTDAGKLRFGVKATEGAEQFASRCHIESCAVVADEESGGAVLLLNAKFDPRMLGLAGVFPRITQQILKCDAKKP